MKCLETEHLVLKVTKSGTRELNYIDLVFLIKSNFITAQKIMLKKKSVHYIELLKTKAGQ